jgi:hypothetical protein
VGASFLKKPGPGSASSEFLNWEFGIRPLISDYQKFAKAYKDRSKILKQLQRDSGRKVRRRYTFPTEKETLVEELPSTYRPFPALVTYLYAGTGKTTRTTVTTRNRWFSGAYTYYLPKSDSAFDKFLRYEAEANKLLGTRVTPEVLWNLAPWSWAVDWLANTGDVLHNLDAFSRDGLVLLYGYMMEHSVCEVTYEYSGNFVVDGKSVPRHYSMTYGYETKVRRKATPYGFGLSEVSFNPTQKAIIAALGINRVSKR